ncbi:hypothetical protein [Aurantimonas sp. A3-2-R12]|uniref:hypothetical protein n=1 Tax=Aurantimonas sp. A3-2-R12 TaxID=3114362 RepID=UPI002E173457|nr:hypothetical protein [Aurantimonas sp. A3-2-R12]
MPLSPPDLDYDPRNIPPEYLQAIGLVAACAAQTESSIEMAIMGCLGVESQYGMALTTHMSAPLRDDALRAVAEIRIDDLDALDELDRILDHIKTAMQKRHSTVHNQWGYSAEKGTVYTTHITARGTVKGDLIPMKLEDIHDDALAIYSAGIELVRFLLAFDLMPHIGPNASRFHKTKVARKKRRAAREKAV